MFQRRIEGRGEEKYGIERSNCKRSSTSERNMDHRLAVSAGWTVSLPAVVSDDNLTFRSHARIDRTRRIGARTSFDHRHDDGSGLLIKHHYTIRRLLRKTRSYERERRYTEREYVCLCVSVCIQSHWKKNAPTDLAFRRQTPFAKSSQRERWNRERERERRDKVSPGKVGRSINALIWKVEVREGGEKSGAHFAKERPTFEAEKLWPALPRYSDRSPLENGRRAL